MQWKLKTNNAYEVFYIHKCPKIIKKIYNFSVSEISSLPVLKSAGTSTFDACVTVLNMLHNNIAYYYTHVFELNISVKYRYNAPPKLTTLLYINEFQQNQQHKE